MAYIALPNINTYGQVSRDAQVALEEFKSDFMAAFMAEDDAEDLWAEQIGTVATTKGLRVTWPISLSAAEYKLKDGDPHFRRLSERSISLVPDLYEDAFYEFARVVEAPEFIGWLLEPASCANAAKQLRNKLISTLLESSAGAGPLSWEAGDVAGMTVFNTAHPYDVLNVAKGTYSNLITGAGTDLTPTNIGIARQNFGAIKGPNGYPLGVKFWGVLIPRALEEQMKRIAQQDLVPQLLGTATGAVNNIYKGTNYVVSDFLTSTTKWYPIGVKNGMSPWIICDRGEPETIVFDKSDALYKLEDKVGMRLKMETTAGIAFPALLQSWAGTAP